MASFDQGERINPGFGKTDRFNLRNVLDFPVDRYNLVQLFGEPTFFTETDPKRKSVNVVMGVALKQLAGGLYLDGSVIQVPRLGSELTKVLSDERWLRQADPVMLNAVMRGLWGAEKSVSEMSDHEYLGSLIAGMMIGPSVDLRSERVDWRETEVDTLVDLWRTQLEPGMFITKIIHGPRAMLYLNHKDGRRGGMFFHAQLESDISGEKLPSSIWSRQNSWRKSQVGRLEQSPSTGMFSLTTGELPNKDTLLKLLIKPDSLGQGCQLLARGIRTLIMFGAQPELMDKDSFALRGDLPNKFTMQQYTDTMSHLLVAFFQNPGDVKSMLLNAGYKLEKLVEWPVSAKDILSYLQANQDVGASSWGLMLNDCDVMMRGADEVDNAASFSGIGQLKMLAPLFELLSPLSYQEAISVVKNTPRLQIEACGCDVEWNSVRRGLSAIGLAATFNGKAEAGEKLAAAANTLRVDSESHLSDVSIDNLAETV